MPASNDSMLAADTFPVGAAGKAAHKAVITLHALH
jgi:hypothetical protein